MMRLFKKRERTLADFGKNPIDFEQRCAFPEQIRHIGRGTKSGNGEEVEVDMKSGKTAIFKLYGARVSYVFEDTGQRHWKYLFIRYKEPSTPILTKEAI